MLLVADPSDKTLVTLGQTKKYLKNKCLNCVSFDLHTIRNNTMNLTLLAISEIDLFVIYNISKRNLQSTDNAKAFVRFLATPHPI